jgi:hypothetical protein
VIGTSRVAFNVATVPGQRPRILGSEDVSSGTVAVTGNNSDHLTLGSD